MQKEDFILKTWPFLLVMVLYVLSGLTLHKYYGEEALHLIFNAQHSSLGDFFFRYFTKTGEFFFGLLVLLWIVYSKNVRWILMFLSGVFVQMLLVQGVKKAFFIDHLRPAYFFEEKGIDLHLVEGVKQGITFTFPSGHTATAFFVFLFLAMLTKNRVLQFLFGIFAVLGAYSRIYLSQHFMLDTVAGAIIGVFTVIVSYYLWQNSSLPFLDKKLIKR